MQTPMCLQLKDDPAVPNEVKDWLREIEIFVLETQTMSPRFTPTQILARFVQMGVEVVGGCDCEGLFEDPPWQWLHENHQRYNRAVWELVHEIMPQILLPLVADLNEPDCTINGWVFGKIVAKDYGRKLLDSFLRDDPHSEWVGQME